MGVFPLLTFNQGSILIRVKFVQTHGQVMCVVV